MKIVKMYDTETMGLGKRLFAFEMEDGTIYTGTIADGIITLHRPLETMGLKKENLGKIADYEEFLFKHQEAIDKFNANNK